MRNLLQLVGSWAVWVSRYTPDNMYLCRVIIIRSRWPRCLSFANNSRSCYELSIIFAVPAGHNRYVFVREIAIACTVWACFAYYWPPQMQTPYKCLCTCKIDSVLCCINAYKVVTKRMRWACTRCGYTTKVTASVARSTWRYNIKININVTKRITAISYFLRYLGN